MNLSTLPTNVFESLTHNKPLPHDEASLGIAEVVQESIFIVVSFTDDRQPAVWILNRTTETWHRKWGYERLTKV